MDKDLYYSLILDKCLDEPNLSEEDAKLLEEAEKYFIEKSKQNMGIGMMCASYIFVRDGDDIWAEYSKIMQFIQEYLIKFAKNKGKELEDFGFEFINYGRTQIVYVLTDKATNEKVTILVKQPVVEYGKVKQEADYLKSLKLVDDLVVAPIDYYSNGEQELYVTPYIEQARCVASDRKWGVYVPEPFYRFEDFSKKQESVVNACMIAKLVSMYDFENNQGIAACKLGGGDFMLEKGWEDKPLTIENTLKSLYFIAAREMLKCLFEDYLKIIKSEFSRATINENQDELLINIRGRVAMNIQDIESGIELGKQIISKRKSAEENTFAK
ncbi:MAG: hypothetical protein IJA23_03900 [Clostridia bacterium]|nr:hypothetical protein [Clostridia bacterium]